MFAKFHQHAKLMRNWTIFEGWQKIVTLLSTLKNDETLVLQSCDNKASVSMEQVRAWQDVDGDVYNNCGSVNNNLEPSASNADCLFSRVTSGVVLSDDDTVLETEGNYQT